MAHHVLSTPVTEEQVRALRVDDTVTLQRTLFGIRDATQIAMFDRGRTTRLRPAGPRGDPHRAERAQGAARAEFPAGYAPVCIGTTTSAAWNASRAPLMAQRRRAH